MADNDISGAFKRKEYWWFGFYIAAAVLSYRLAGIVGCIVSVLVVAGLYKVIKNQSHSLSKKIALSSLYIGGGVAATYLGTMLLVTFVLPAIVGQRAVDSLNPDFREAQTRTLSDQTFTSSTTPTPSSASTATVPTTQLNSDSTAQSQQNSNLENTAYFDSQWKFSIRYPKGWLINTSGENGTVEFDVPRDDEVALETVTAETATGYDLQTYAKLVQQGFFSSEGGPNANLKIIAQGNATLNGQPAYQFEVTSEFTNGGSTFPIHGLYTVAVHGDIGYVIFSSSFEQLWPKYRDVFKASIASFKFPSN